MRVLVTGSRHTTKLREIETILDFLKALHGEITIIHGGAVGADRCAHRWAKNNQCAVDEFPADWEKYGRGAGPVRNREMLEIGKPDLVLAFPEPDSIGTVDCINQARAMGLKVIVHGESDVSI